MSVAEHRMSLPREGCQVSIFGDIKKNNWKTMMVPISGGDLKRELDNLWKLFPTSAIV